MALISTELSCSAWTTALVLCLFGCAGAEPDGVGTADRSTVVRFETARQLGEADRVWAEGLGRATLRELRRAELAYEEWIEIFPVRVSSGSGPRDSPTLLGSYAIEGGRVRFSPRFPFEPGVSYAAVWNGTSAETAGGAHASLTLRHSAGAPSTEVAAIYPSGSELPENLLRIYIHFSAPMSRGEAASRVRLIGPEGEVPIPFVAPEHELWSPDRRRLTLLLDPGRIKQEVGPNVALGAPLVAGSSYRLVVDAGWRDGGGLPLARDHVKEFRAVAADRKSPVPEQWDLYPPGGAREIVQLRFPEPLDRALLEHTIRVENASAEPLDGDVRIGEEEGSWTFRPSRPWPEGELRLVVDPILEDPSGNSVRRPFDSRLRAAVGAGERREPVVLRFEVVRQDLG